MGKLSEWGDKLSAHPFFLLMFNGTLVALWIIIGTEIANIFISIITAELVLLAAGANRRGFLAIHGKLDEIIDCLPEARNELLHLEEETEEKIRKLRK